MLVENISALTISDKAAHEMLERLEKQTTTSDLTISTFHAFALSLQDNVLDPGLSFTGSVPIQRAAWGSHQVKAGHLHRVGYLHRTCHRHTKCHLHHRKNISPALPVQFIDEPVELLDRHDGNSFIEPYVLFDEGDEEGNRILVRDRCIKHGSFFMLLDRLF